MLQKWEDVLYVNPSEVDKLELWTVGVTSHRCPCDTLEAAEAFQLAVVYESFSQALPRRYVFIAT